MSAKAVVSIILFIICISKSADAQRVGIGTTNPLRKLSVTGSIQVDQNSNNAGSLDSAALVFGNGGQAGISSRQIGGDPQSLTFWTNGIPYMNLSSQGDLGVGGGANASYRLWVKNGHARISGNAYIDEEISSEGSAAFGGPVDAAYRLRVWGGHTRFGGDMHATGNVGIGGLPDNNFGLRVYNGNTRLEGNVQISGHTALNSIGASGNISSAGTVTAVNANITNSLTIDGKGSVRSNGPSSLRIGFDSKPVSVLLPANGGMTVTADISDFDGDNDDVRVFVSQIVSGAGNTLMTDNVKVIVTSVDAAANTCNLRLTNLSNVNATLTATIYLTTIAKN